MAWINPSTVVSGGSLNATKWNQDVVANTEFLAKPPSCRVVRTTEQSVANNAWRAISWGSESWDTDTMWSSTAPTRIDINTAGKYMISVAGIRFDGSTGGAGRILGIVRNAGSSTGTAERFAAVPPTVLGDDAMMLGFTVIQSFTSTESFRVSVLQDSGGASNIQHSTNVIEPQCTVMWMSS